MSKQLNSQLVRLHRTLWIRTLTSNPSTILIALMILFYGAGGAVSVMFPAVSEFDDGAGTAFGFSGVAALGALALIMISVMMPAGEKQLFPADLRTMPVTPGQVRSGFARMIVWNSRTLICLVYSLVFAVIIAVLLARAGLVAGAVAFAVGVALTAATIIILADCVGMIGAAAERTKSSQRTMLAGLAGLALYFVLLVTLDFNTMDSIPTARIGEVLAFTPFGAATGFASALIDGSLVRALVFAALAVAYLAAAIALWRWLFAKSFEAPESLTAQTSSASSRSTGVITLGPLPAASPFWAEYSRTLRYVIRDSRLALSMVMAPLLAVFYAFTSEGPLMYMGLIIIALVGGLIACNDYGYDGPSLWTKIVSPVRGSRLFLARHLAHVSLPLLMLLVASVVFMLLSGDAQFGLAALAVSLGFFFSAAALSALLTVVNPYATSRPGTNPWTDKSGYSASAFIAVFAVLFLGWIPVVPAVLTFISAYAWKTGEWDPALFASGTALAIAIPAALYGIVIFMMTKRVDKKLPEIYSKVSAYVS